MVYIYNLKRTSLVKMKVVVVTENNIGAALAHELTKLGFDVVCLHVGTVNLATRYMRPIPIDKKLIAHHIALHRPDVVVNTCWIAVTFTCLLPYRTIYVVIMPNVIEDPLVYNELIMRAIRLSKTLGHSILRCGVIAASFRYGDVIYPSQLFASLHGSTRAYHLSSFKTILRFVIRWILAGGAYSSTMLVNNYRWTAKDILAVSGFTGSKYEPGQFDFTALQTVTPPRSPLFGENPDHTIEELRDFYEL